METISNQNQPIAAIADAVCPHCFKLLTSPFVADQGVDSYEREIRTYYGWCFECKLGAMVIQFSRGGRWVIHKYQNYELLETLNLCRPSGGWVTKEELPLPAPVATGPGGVYVKYHELQVVTLKNVIEALEKAKQTLIAILQ